MPIMQFANSLKINKRGDSGFIALLGNRQNKSSQSRAGKCTDNAVTERFFRSLKVEKLNGYRFKTREQALLCVAEYRGFLQSEAPSFCIGKPLPNAV